jgi:integrase
MKDACAVGRVESDLQQNRAPAQPDVLPYIVASIYVAPSVDDGGCNHGATRPAREVGIEKRIGWHTFRHTYSTLLRSVGTEFKVMQELLRHSSFRSTVDIYTQAITPAKHAAQAAVMSLVFASKPEFR